MDLPDQWAWDRASYGACDQSTTNTSVAGAVGEVALMAAEDTCQLSVDVSVLFAEENGEITQVRFGQEALEVAGVDASGCS